MIEPPSSHLVETLLDLKLCSAADLRRCRRSVKRLARDLPAFDSVWIDALLQARRLTPFQATLIGSADSHRLSVGPCVLVDRLGRGKDAETFIARQRDGNERCTLKLIRTTDDVRDAVQARLEHLANLVREESHPSIVTPRVAMSVDDEIAVVSRFVPGAHLGELLVRRGRFPHQIVVEMVAQLIDGLAQFERLGVVHGEIGLTNVRLTANGAAVLVDYGVRPAVSPEFTIHSALRAERCEGVAPELIGTGELPTSASDVYALGCLLWQLLAGRPPYPTADPLAKLACHQTKRVLDVRELAPDVPAHLAEAVRAFTNPDPGQRPHSFRDVCERWKQARRAGRKRIAGFAAGFNSAAPRIPIAAREASGSKWPVMLVLLFVLSGASLTLMDNGKFSLPLSIRKKAVDLWNAAQLKLAENPGGEEIAHTEAASSSTYAEMPDPSADGVVILDTDGPYQARRYEMVGALTLRGKPGCQPIVVAGEEPLFVVATQLAMENVHFRRPANNGSSGSAASSLLKIRAERVLLQSCSFDVEPIANGNSAVAQADIPEWAASSEGDPLPQSMIDWKTVGDANAGRGAILMKNSVFLGRVPAVMLQSVPQSVQVANCLKVGGSTFLELAQPPKPQVQFRCELAQVTLRDCDGFLAVRMPEAKPAAGLIEIVTTNCVFHIPAKETAFVEFVSQRPVDETNLRVEVTGQSTLANRDFAAARWVDTRQSTSVELRTDAVFLDGIVTPPFEFVGQASSAPEDSALKPFEGQQDSAAPPGIHASLLRAPRAAETRALD